MLTQLGIAFRTTKQSVYSAVFQCSCGNKKVMIVGRVKRGCAKTCGACVMKGKRKTKNRNRLRTTWRNMIERCGNRNHPDYGKYGGRGILVDELWKDFQQFAKDMGDAPAGMTLERIDNQNGYSASNCRWASRTSQARNKRNNLRVTVDGVSMVLAEAAERLGINRRTLARRLKHAG
jgi:transcriptional regulator with GAF, ATPase, and Fis domain